MNRIEIFNKIHHLIGTPYVTTVKAYLNELTGFTVSDPRPYGPSNATVLGPAHQHWRNAHQMRSNTLDIVTCNEGKILWFEFR